MAAVVLEGIKFNLLEVKVHFHLQQECLCQLCLGCRRNSTDYGCGQSRNGLQYVHTSLNI